MTANDLGMTLRDDGARGLAISNLNFVGVAKKAGLNFGDVIVGMKVANPARYSARWLYLPAFLLLGLVMLWNWRGREKPALAAA